MGYCDFTGCFRNPLFVSEDISAVLEYARIYIVICGSCFVPLGMIFIFRNAIQGCGFGLIPVLGGVVELLCRSVAAFVAANMLSYEGVCMGGNRSFPLGWIPLYNEENDTG